MHGFTGAPAWPARRAERSQLTRKAHTATRGAVAIGVRLVLVRKRAQAHALWFGPKVAPRDLHKHSTRGHVKCHRARHEAVAYGPETRGLGAGGQAKAHQGGAGGRDDPALRKCLRERIVCGVEPVADLFRCLSGARLSRGG